MDLSQFIRFVNTTFLRKVENIVQQYNEDLPLRVLPYIMKNMWPGQNPAGIDARNDTDKLYRRTGTLVQALRTGSPGNITKITTRQATSTLDYGIDVSRVPYALFHETGTRKMRPRPYLSPGIIEFRRRALEQIQQQLLNKLTEAYNQIYGTP